LTGPICTAHQRSRSTLPLRGPPGGPEVSVSFGSAKGVVRDLHPQQLPEPFARSDPANLFGSLSNFVLHPAEQKWYVFPACCEEPAAWLGSTCIPQTGSVCVVVVCVVIIDFLSISVAVRGASGWSIQPVGRSVRARTKVHIPAPTVSNSVWNQRYQNAVKTQTQNPGTETG
jgi:hypothetical protein